MHQDNSLKSFFYSMCMAFIVLRRIRLACLMLYSSGKVTNDQKVKIFANFVKYDGNNPKKGKWQYILRNRVSILSEQEVEGHSR